jgi:hypothetical protein
VHCAPGRVWALEGTGSFAAGLVTVLAEAGEDGSTGSSAQPEPPLSIGSRSERFARSLLVFGS